MYHLIGRPLLSKLSRQKILIKHREFQSSPDYYANCIEIYGHDRALRSGKLLHAYLIVTGLARSTYLSSKLIIFYTQCKHIQDARKLFDQIPETNMGRWIVLIGAYSRQGFYQETIELFVGMQREGLKPNKFILPSSLRACANLSDGKTGEKIHGIVLRSLLDVDTFVDSALVDMYSKCGKIDKAKLVFDRMVDKDVVAWNSMVSGYVQQGCVREALGLVEEMKLVGLKPNLVTWNALVAGFSQAGSDAMALKLFQMMQDNGIEPDVISWTSIISGFVRNFKYNKAFSTFKQMLASKVWPSSFTISCLLPACATVADLKHGKEIHGYALATGVEEDIFVCSSLVDMYAKCGNIFEARTLFNKMPERNTVTCNSMIFGYANNGDSTEAFQLFNQMLEKKEVKPDHLTFTAALMACSHFGMVEVGWNVFHSMWKEHGIEPRLEHYACMVDVLGRAGELSEAYNFIKTMPIKPDSFVWGALLGACKNHGNVEFAERAAKCLKDLEAVSAGSCLLLSNLYADVGKWRDAEKLKKMIKRKRLGTSSGCSWILG
ncbi:Pentatricopeptide repeat-containing protein [Thalictrum thalictroides]|uniref:Pentatricopeptide repeat-containing protein n=1 Tax=Thalictrum thalictroides TaxID=46969 RepID=A0A7J6XGQ8_THATH|nr:Pentatricopeptide repeat-containing protein [Thalictrum thalictroides]